ncbi:TlpA disulfide reductase family protein [Embleya sp. NPDC050154]|uniref:TlpA disulfide reductase family protein n=1 Tax=unclassified Embleya TaxID=2699296 RepID=UPI0037AE6D58
MPLLIAALTLVGSLCLLNLILTVGVIKRLREHTEMLANVGGAGNGRASITVGEEVGDFTASTVDGEQLARDLLVGETLVAFFSPTCKPCKEKLPKFLDFAATLPGGRDRVLATVVGDTEASAALVAELTPVARVIVEEYDGALSAAFQAKAYPTLLMVARDGAGRLVVTEDEVRLGHLAIA